MLKIYHPPAKINLGLWILGRRKDGYHELETIFHEIPLYDELIIEESSTSDFYCQDFPSDDNLCVVAWRALEAKVGRPLPAKITLNKKIPSCAGLGGASSDASYTLIALNELHHLQLSDEDLECLAGSIGSDTAFFVKGGCQIGRGRGEILEECDISLQCSLLLAVPSFGCSTSSVFSCVSGPFSSKKDQYKCLKHALQTGKLSEVTCCMYNDLTLPAQKSAPRLIDFMTALSQQYQCPSFLSGSGSSCFILMDKPVQRPPHFNGRYLALFDMSQNKCLWELSHET